uniref:Matrix-remodeling-associated protein 7 helical domain-containing protein n=1 Tax=Astatotilapia calliptera TaxID=8154 RepID=A0A3P8RES9_ASTCA
MFGGDYCKQRDGRLSAYADFANARSYFGHRDGVTGGLDQSGPKQNGHLPDKKKKKEADDWCEISGSSHDHWDVVKSVLSEEAHSHPQSEELETLADWSRPGSRNTILEAESSSNASSGTGRRSLIGLSDTELLKCAFSYPQTEGASERAGMNEKVESNANNSLKYVPGKARSHHLEKMMTKEELEEEQRVQHEQLTAIFQLLKENKETFGEVSEGDIEEQLRLYSI